jgi:hypothetical protein
MLPLQLTVGTAIAWPAIPVEGTFPQVSEAADATELEERVGFPPDTEEELGLEAELVCGFPPLQAGVPPVVVISPAQAAA